jgi:serine/threonine protein kinase
MWSLGILIYEMIHGLPPFYDTDTRRMYEKILNSKLSFSRYFSPGAKDLVSQLLIR